MPCVRILSGPRHSHSGTAEGGNYTTVTVMEVDEEVVEEDDVVVTKTGGEQIRRALIH